MQQLAKKLESWFHFGIGALTIGTMFKMAFYIGERVHDGIFPWWVYLAFAAYVVAILMLDHVLFSKSR